MPKVKWAQLSSDLPDDQVEEDGAVVVYGGQAACASIIRTLKEMGFKGEALIQNGMNGWAFYSRRERLKVWMQITDWGGGYLLGVAEDRFFSTRSRRAWFDEHFLVPFNEALKRNKDFTRVAWTNPNKEIEGGDRTSPTDPAVPWV